jgi:MFS family permease
MIGILYSVNGLAVVFLQMPVNWVLARMRDFNRIALGGAIYSMGFFVLAFFSGFPFLIADVIFLTIGENVMSPVTYSLIGKISPAEKRGQYFGAFQLLLGLIAPMAPVLGTGLLSRFSYDPLLVWLPILVIGISMSFLVSRVGMIMRSERKPESYETKL